MRSEATAVGPKVSGTGDNTLFPGLLKLEDLWGNNQKRSFSGQRIPPFTFLERGREGGSWLDKFWTSPPGM